MTVLIAGGNDFFVSEDGIDLDRELDFETEEGFHGLTMTPDGTLYGTNTDGLYRIDMQTGDITFLFESSDSAYGDNGLGSDSSGTLLIGDQYEVYEYDPISGEVGAIYDLDGEYVDGALVADDTTVIVATNRGVSIIDRASRDVVETIDFGLGAIGGMAVGGPGGDDVLIYSTDNVWRLLPDGVEELGSLNRTGHVSGTTSSEYLEIPERFQAAQFIEDEPSEPTTPLPDRTFQVGTDGEDSLIGTDGDDELYGLAGNDFLAGNAGDDTLAGADGNDLIAGDEGNDSLGGGFGADTMLGDAGNDTLGGGRGDDEVYGVDGNDVIAGGPGNDTVVGGIGDDTIGGSFGDDEVSGSEGDDSLGGGTGKDTIYGYTGDDSVGGGEGDDVIYGFDGDDFLAGGGRNDSIRGGDDNDTINGGEGSDTLAGGEGSDVFVWNEFSSGSVDVVTDFDDGMDSFRMTGIENAPGSGLQGYLDELDIVDLAGGGVSMSYGGNTIIVQGISSADLTLSDFVFI
ncbi:calcium-binding protein [Roseivivax marinus]|uniref:calcium-binding protein n=1 Tax=Roseivivax marinus TaxID=1379903 RepID=UPI00273F75B5|nr:calcium-binding protein [Roseivivax marinus]